jgi:hypothetical protein
MFGAKLTTALVVGVAVWPAGAYASTDPPSPVVPNTAAAPQDLRSPDTRDAALKVEALGVQDLRSPDARDAAREVAIAAPTATHAEVPATGPTASVSDGFEWGDAGIGAAVIFGLVSLASAAVLVTGRGRGRAPAGPHA